MEEVERIGKEISNIDPNLQVCVLVIGLNLEEVLWRGK